MNDNIETLNQDDIRSLEKNDRINQNIFNSLEDDFKKEVDELATKFAGDVIDLYDKYGIFGFSYCDLVDIVATLAGPKTFED